MYKYVVIWSDDFPACFYETVNDARQAIRESEYNGYILTMDEYLNGEEE